MPQYSHVGGDIWLHTPCLSTISVWACVFPVPSDSHDSSSICTCWNSISYSKFIWDKLFWFKERNGVPCTEYYVQTPVLIRTRASEMDGWINKYIHTYHFPLRYTIIQWSSSGVPFSSSKMHCSRYVVVLTHTPSPCSREPPLPTAVCPSIPQAGQGREDRQVSRYQAGKHW